MKKYIFVSLAAFSILLVFFSLSAAAAGVSRGRSAAPGLIPDELKSVQIEDYFVGSGGNSVGSIQNATGHVVVVHKDAKSAYFAAAGDAVYQQDVFYTLKDSRCRIKFSTEDIITMGENGKVVADEVVDDQVAKKKSSIISMLKGKAMFYVVRLFKYKTVSASVKTPTAVMGVRGTKFGVEVRKVGKKVADLSDNSFIYLAQNEPGDFETVVYGFEGSVGVTPTGGGSTQNVGAGETLVIDNLGAGDVEPTDPAAANQFLGDTEGGAGGGGDGSGDSGEGETGGGGETGETGDAAAENIAQTLTGLANEQLIGPTGRMGYFTAMLTNGSGSYIDGLFLSDSLQDLNGMGKIATDPETDFIMEIHGLAGNAGQLASVDFGEGGIITGPYPISRTELAHNAYMEWGYWTQTAPMQDGESDYYYVNNRGYYIAGDNTIDMASLNINAWWLYSGGAEGTYWEAAGGTNMTGTFDAKVNFMVGAIYDFNLSVEGGDHYARVTGAGGGFDNRGGASNFNVVGGTAVIGSQQSNGTFMASGSVYGPAAQSIGGVWGIVENILVPTKYATGIFHGDKQGATTAPLGEFTLED